MARRRSPIAEAMKAAAAREIVQHDYPQAPKELTGDEPTVVLHFEAPEPPISVNRTNGRHWAEVTTHKKLWEHAGFQAATQAAHELEPLRGKRIRMTWALPVSRPGACDAGNYIGGPSVKAGQDGVTRSRVLIPDDTSVWLETVVVFWKGGTVAVKVEAVEPLRDPKEWAHGANQGIPA